MGSIQDSVDSHKDDGDDHGRGGDGATVVGVGSAATNDSDSTGLPRYTT